MTLEHYPCKHIKALRVEPPPNLIHAFNNSAAIDHFRVSSVDSMLFSLHTREKIG